MKRFIKILAVLMAMLMLVSMATACKSQNEDMDSFLSGETNINDDNGEGGSVDVDDEGEDPSDPSGGGNSKDPAKNEGGNSKNPGSSNSNGGANKDPVGDKVDEEKWNEIVEDYTGEVKYEADKNPLVAEA